ncbi:FAD-dependent oxidoreductase, partial [Lactobacillus sp. XV13L]|nr:FAD-dependent oxidoreductase [Lactobacillus sp. XV13L]
TKTYDVIIVGGGLAGFAAATEAADRHLAALVLEKGRTTGGTGNYVEGVFAAESKMQKAAGIDVKGEEILHLEMEYSHYKADHEMWRHYIKQSAGNVGWLQEHGVQFDQVTNMGTGLPAWHLFTGHGDKAIHEALQPYAEKNNIEIRTSMQVDGLTPNPDGSWTIEAQDLAQDHRTEFQAKNIILATGGYLNNPEIMRNANKYNSQRIIPVNSGKSTGDGLQLAWKQGAKRFFTGMTMNFGGQIHDAKTPTYKFATWDLGSAVCDEPVLWVNEAGNRFTNEYDCVTNWANEGNAMIRQDRVFAILDQKTIDDFTDKGFPLDLHPFYELPNYPHLRAEVKQAMRDQLDFMNAAATLEELATKIAAPNLTATVARYNELAEKGVDVDFGKDEAYLLPVNKGPFYAIEMDVGAFTTGDGLKVNLNNEVLNEAGRPLTHLYAVGSDGAGVIYGDTYGVEVPGSHAGYCVYSGRNAVRDLSSKL